MTGLDIVVVIGEPEIPSFGSIGAKVDWAR